MDNPQHYQPLSHALHPPVVQPPYEEEEEEEEENEDEGAVEEQLDREDDEHEVAAGCVITVKHCDYVFLIGITRVNMPTRHQIYTRRASKHNCSWKTARRYNTTRPTTRRRTEKTSWSSTGIEK